MTSRDLEKAALERAAALAASGDHPELESRMADFQAAVKRTGQAIKDAERRFQELIDLVNFLDG